MIGIYKITSPSGKVYIGQSINIKQRLKDYKKLNCKKQPKLYRSFLKYGYEKHKIEILENCSLEELNCRERFYQDLFECVDKGLNCFLTKSTDKSGKHSEETKKKLSESQKKVPQETRDRIAGLLRGRKRPEYVKLKISETSKKRVFSEESKLRLAEFGRNMSEETLLKMSKSATGKIQSQETKNKISRSLKGRKHTNETKLKISTIHGKKVIDTVSGLEFLSVAKAAKHFGCNISNLHQKLKGIRNNNTNLKFL